jgi:hypothetical protein
MEQLLGKMAERAESLATNHVIQRILRPISSAIASRS